MRVKSNKLALRVLSTATFLAMVSSCATAAFAGTYYMEDGSISIVAKTDGNYITQGDINDKKDEGETVITNHDSETASKNTVTIKAEEDCTANVTLDNVNIDASETGKAAIHTEGNVTLELDGDNTLTGGTGHAGLEKNDNTGNGTLIIKDDKNDDGTEKTEEQKKAETESGKGAGSLTATGGAGGAGIGGASSRSSSNITITGGSITATAGSNTGTRLVYCGAGIGGGYLHSGNDITITGGEITVYASPEHLAAPLAALRRMGCRITTGEQSITLTAPEHLQGAGSIVTLPYPGFPTDLQAIFMALAAAAEGYTAFTETVFPRRWAHVEELRRLGADITVVGSHAVIRGAPLIGSALTCTDLRAGAAVVLAALAAKGESSVTAISHIERGYADFVPTLRHLGADICLTEV